MDKLIEYLKVIREHYSSLSELMSAQNKDIYKYEHLGKVNFIDLLLYKITNGDFND